MAGAKETIHIEVTGNSAELAAALKKAGIEFKQFGQEGEKAGQAGQKAGMGARDIIKGLAGFAIVQQSAQMLKEFAVESFKAAAQAEALGQATDNLAKGIGESGDAMVSAIQQASGQTISQLGAMQAANKAMMFGLVENKGQMAELTQIAITLGAAMGQDATKSIDDLTTALGRQSPMILDNLGITLKLEEAYQIYAAQLGKTVEQLTEQEKKQAFVNAALEKGKERVAQLGDATTGAAADSQRLSAAWSDFQVAFGGLLTQMSGGINIATQFIRALERGANSWAWIIDTNAALKDADNTMARFVGGSLEGMVAAAIPGGAAILNLSNALTTTADAAEQNAVAHQNSAAAMDLAGAKAQFQAAMAEKAEQAQRAQSAEAERWAGIAQAGTQILDELAQGHTMTALETERYAEAQEKAAQAEAERQQMMQGLAGAAANYFLSIKDLQDQNIQGEASYHANIASMRADAQADITAKETELSEKLAEIEQQRQEKLHWVLTGAHERTQAENDAALAHWNEHFDQLVNDTTAKYGEQTTAMEQALADQEAKAAAARAKEQAAYEQHLEELKLKTALGVLETTGQLEQLTGGLATSASDAVALIQAGIIPVTQEMAMAIQGSLGELATQSEQASATAAANQDVLKQALEGTLEPATALQTGLGLIGSDRSGIDNMLPAMDELKVKSAEVEASVAGVNAALAGLGGGGGMSAEGGQGAGGEGAAPGEGMGGGGGGLEGLVSAAGELSAMFGQTLPEATMVFTEAHTAMSELMWEELALTLESVVLLDTQWLLMIEETIPTLQNTGLAATTALTGGFNQVKAASEMASNVTESGFNRASDVLRKLPDDLSEIVEWLDKVTSSAQRAAGALNNMRSSSSSSGIGGRAAGGPVEAGRAYVVGERGPELFVAPAGGVIVPNHALMFGNGGDSPLDFGGGGNSQQLIIQNVNIYESSDPRRAFEAIKQEAERRGYKFSRN